MNEKIIHELLLIEDNDDHAEMTSYYLEEALQGEVNIHRLSDGEKAINFIRDFNETSTLPSLIFLDLKIPKHDGHEILKKLKSHSNLKMVPVIVFTTSNSQSDITRAYENHANSYILKPIEVGKLKKIFKTIAHYWLINEKAL
ncbi:MAG: response regulator [Nitrospinae bacterium]|nr:response regulator [Nitrospinota bacterium]